MKEFCPNKASKEFKELASIFGEDKAYFLWMRNKGNELDKAPNGAESKLFKTLLDEFNGNRVEALKAKAKVYSNDFWNWFGDWTAENKDNVSKVVDENGEPAIMYHGTPWGEFDVFRQLQPNTGDRTKPGEIYFSASKSWADSYTKGDFNKGLKSPKVYAVYLDVKNPYFPGKNPQTRKEANAILFEDYGTILTDEEYDDIYKALDETGALIESLSPSQWNPKIYDYDIYNHIASYFKYKNQEERFIEVIKQIRQKGLHDGMIWLTREEQQGKRISFDGQKRQVWIMDPNQVKSIISNKQDIITGEPGFSTTDDNIYHHIYYLLFLMPTHWFK